MIYTPRLMDDLNFLDERIERDIQTLRSAIAKMSKMVLRQLEDAVAAFTDDNRKLAYKVVLKDHQIDIMEDHIDRLSQEFLIRHMPVSEQLRFVVAVAKVNSELERIGDYAEAIGRKTVTIADTSSLPERERILEMSRVAFQMLRNATEAFIKGDPDIAMRTLDSDRVVNGMNASLYESLATPDYGHEDLKVCFALLGIVNRIERVADRACNIAEETVYVTKGEVLRHLPREDMRVLFISDHNSCRSQMAEAIARKLAPANFIFSSAGLRPTQLDPTLIEFMRNKGIDVSRQRPKKIQDVGPLEDFNIVVTLSQGAEEISPDIPYRAVQLAWDIGNPSKVTDGEESTEKAYQNAFEVLNSKITDLKEGLAGAFDKGEDE